MLLRFVSTMPNFRQRMSNQQCHFQDDHVVLRHSHQHSLHDVLDDKCCFDNPSIETLSQSVQENHEEYFFSDPYHSQQILTGLNCSRQDSSFCDVTLCVDGKEFKCHKIVLIAFSPYFKAMFGGELAESQQDHVSLNGIEAPMMELLIKFAYTSDIIINKSNVQSLLSAANLLEVLAVRDACCDFLEKQMDVTNCVGIHCFAEAHACSELQEKAKSCVLKYFNQVVKQEEFLGLSHSKLAEFISSDVLSVFHEEHAFEAVVLWLKHDVQNRKKLFHEVLEHVRLPLISPYYLLDCVEQLEEVQECRRCMELVEEAKKYHLLPDRRLELASVRTRPRKNAGIMEVLITVGGEDDKVVSRSVDCLDPKGMIWKKLESTPFAVSKHGLVVSGNNMMYLAGGEFPDGTASKAVWRYDSVFNSWQEMQSMNSERLELGLAVVDGMMYAVGGWNGTDRLDSVEQYDPKTNTWVFVSPMKIAITSPAVVSFNGQLIVTGGAILEDGDGVDYVQSYDPKTDTWIDLAPMSIARSGSAACVLNNRIYVIGGWHASTENTNKTECYFPESNKWKLLSPMKTRRYKAGAAVVDGKIYVFGGEEGCDRYHETVECYDEKLNSWSIIGKMAASRSSIGCATLRLHTECFCQEKV